MTPYLSISSLCLLDKLTLESGPPWLCRRALSSGASPTVVAQSRVPSWHIFGTSRDLVDLLPHRRPRCWGWRSAVAPTPTLNN